MQHLEVSGAVQHIYIYIYVIRRLKVKLRILFKNSLFGVELNDFGMYIEL